MIRINLLRVRALKERRKASGALHLLVFFVCLGIEIAVIVLVHAGISADIAKEKDKASELSRLLAQQRAKMSDNQQKQEELARINKKREVIEQLEAARTGPVTMLHEVIKVLSKGGGPSMDEDTERWLREERRGPGFNRGWDWRKIWLERFGEADREVTFEGRAMDVEDISEFQRRLNLSQYFEDIRWVRSPEERASATGETQYSFVLRGRVIFPAREAPAVPQ